MIIDPTKTDSPTELFGESIVPLESVLCTEELNKRPQRSPDYEKENRMLLALVELLADSPRNILPIMTEMMLEEFSVGSSGISLLTNDDGEKFCWPAISGIWKSHIGDHTPCNSSPSGDVIDRNAPLLFKHIERRYTYFLPVTPPVKEALLVPFYVRGKAVGTIWLIAHDDHRKFDAEDLRQLVNLSKFASSAHQAMEYQEKGVSINEALVLGSLRQHEFTEIANSLNVQLQEEITERSKIEKALQEEKYKAQAANMAKSEFLANMSHEIRTPMNAVLGLANILAMSKDMPKEKQLEIVSTLQLSAQSLLRLINDLLDIAKIETNNIDIEHIPFTFNELISEVFSILSLKAHEKNIALDHVSLPLNAQQFLGDPLRIRQVLINLVGNALKFTEHGGVTINITISAHEEPQHCYVHVAVSDTGIGIAADKLEGIFEKFMQADSSTTRKYGGTGLGLAISKNLAEIMGGSITIKSDQGKGSEFTLHLPLELADEASAYQAIVEDDQKETSEFQAIHGCVLLAEDYKPNVLVASLILESLGYSCDVAINGVEVLEKIRTNRGKYAAVLMDVQMPDMDGFEATKIIREEEKAQDLPHLSIIAMTAHALEGDKERCLNAGMDDYISKPFAPQDLANKLATATTSFEAIPQLCA